MGCFPVSSYHPKPCSNAVAFSTSGDYVPHFLSFLFDQTYGFFVWLIEFYEGSILHYGMKIVEKVALNFLRNLFRMSLLISYM